MADAVTPSYVMIASAEDSSIGFHLIYLLTAAEGNHTISLRYRVKAAWSSLGPCMLTSGNRPNGLISIWPLPFSYESLPLIQTNGVSLIVARHTKAGGSTV